LSTGWYQLSNNKKSPLEGLILVLERII